MLAVGLVGRGLRLVRVGQLGCKGEQSGTGYRAKNEGIYWLWFTVLILSFFGVNHASFPELIRP